MGRSILPSNTWFLEPTRAHNAKGISDRFSRFWQTDQQTYIEADHATPSVTIGHVYERSMAMRPNDN